MKIASLFAEFGIRTSPGSVAGIHRALNGIRRAALGLGTVFAGGSLAKGLVGLNSQMEDAKIQIAGMLALAKKTDLADQVGAANGLYDELRKKAAELPGQTEDYVNMLGFLVQPMAKAGASMKQMEELTVNAMVASRGLKEAWQVAGRDISEFINFGKINVVDKFLRRMIESTGVVVDDAYKKRARAMTKEQRMQIMLAAHSQKAITDMGAAQARSFSGRWDKFRDALKLTIMRIGKPLFESLGKSLEAANAWLTKNEAKVRELADAIGGALALAFDAIKKVVKFLLEDGDRAKAILVGIAAALGAAALNALIVAAPIIFLIGRVAALYYLFEKLRDFLKNDFVAAIVTVLAGALLFNIGKVTRAIWGMVTAWRAARAAAASTAAVGGAGAAVNAMGTGAMMLGPAGKGAPVSSPVGGSKPNPGNAGAANLFLPILAASIANAFIPTRQHSEAFLDDGGLTDVNKMKAFIGTNHGSKAVTDAMSAVNAMGAVSGAVNYSPNTTINVHEATDVEGIAEVIRSMNEEQQRFLQNALSGGKR